MTDVTMSEGRCDGCGRQALLSPLHGPDKGGPLRCFVCAGAWHAEHGRRRKMGRVVIRAIRAFVDGGGSWADVDKLRQTALLGDGIFGLHEAFIDPLGYLADTAKTADETILLTSEILADALRLTHPDAHPLERRELANRVTQQLLVLKPFVFPAVKPKPMVPREPPRNASVKVPGASLEKPLGSRYPCAECASTVPSCRQRAHRNSVKAKEAHDLPARDVFERDLIDAQERWAAAMRRDDAA
jgi:hypothetical protein